MKKLLNKKGFTLMEMLIVVAIIVILIAISIPALSASLDKANKATDAANLRSAKAAFVIEFAENASSGKVYYDLTTGTVTATAPTAGQGKCSKHGDHYIMWSGTDAGWTKDGSTFEYKCD